MSARSGRSSKFQRGLDRWLGIPILFLLGLFHVKSRKPNELKRVAFLKSTAIGDTIILSGAVRSFREKFPAAELVLFVGDSNFEAASLIDGVSQVIKLPVKSPLKTIRAIRDQGEFDVWINFGSWARLEAIYSFFAKAKFSIGFHSSGMGKHFAQDFSVKHSNLIHENLNFNKLLEPLGIGHFFDPMISAKNILSFSIKVPPPFLVFHLWAGGSQANYKEWSEKNWQLLTEMALAEAYQIVLTGGPTDHTKNEDFIHSLALPQTPQRVFNFAGRSLAQTAYLLKNSNGVISVDTGVLHLASAVGAKVVGLHGPTTSSHWGSLSPTSVSLNALDSKEGPLSYGFEDIGDLDLMGKIGPSQVWISVQQLLNH